MMLKIGSMCSGYGGLEMAVAAALPEWMMGLEPGWLTGHLARGDALRLAGNGVCPQQGAAALDALLTP
jgi:DNA (cytosine-5)-methyltransferase 1